MIINYNERWVLCTPTKCGTFSLEGVLIDKLNIGYKLIPRHRVDVPPEVAIKKPERLMIVRDPVERFTSMFWFLTSFSDDVWQCDYKNIEDFVVEYFRRREEEPHWMWTNTMKENFEAFKPHAYFRIEDGLQGIVDHACDLSGVPRTQVGHRNRTKSKREPQETLQSLTPASRSRLKAHLKVDADFLGYFLPNWL